MLNVALKCISLVKQIHFVRLFFFKVMRIIQIFLRWLGKLNVNLLNGWIQWRSIRVLKVFTEYPKIFRKIKICNVNGH